MSVLLYDQPFWVTCHFETGIPYLEQYNIKVRYMCYLSNVRKPKISVHFALRPTVFRSTENGPKMTLSEWVSDIKV